MNMTDVIKFFQSGKRWITGRIVRPLLSGTGTYLLRMAAAPQDEQEMLSPVNHTEWKNKAVSDFDAWLRDLPDELPEPGAIATESCDLYTLMVEFISLRQEIHLQTREQHNTLKIQQSLIEDHREIAALFKSRTLHLEKLEENIRLSSERKVLVPFFDIRDALVRGLTSARKVSETKGIFRKPPKGIEGVVEGYEMTLRRLDRALSYASIAPVDTVGRPFDPTTMQAIDKKSAPDVSPGEVLEQIRSGFIRGGEVLRTAQVVVNTLEK